MKIKCTIGIALAILASPVRADPPPQDGLWRGNLGLALSLASGNTKSSNVSLNAGAVRMTPLDKISLSALGVWGRKEDNGSTIKTAELARAGGEYDYNLSPDVYGYGTLDFTHDKLQSLNLRSVVGAGLGYHVVNTKELAFDVFAGAAFNREQYTGLTRNAAEVMLGEQSTHRIGAATVFTQRLVVYPSLKDSGEYRAAFDASLVTALAGNLSLQVSLTDLYNSNAPFGNKKNDVLLLTGISYKFGP